MREIKFRAWDTKASDHFEKTLEVYRHRPKGMLTNLYHKMKTRSKEKGFGELAFSLEEFQDWSIRNESFLIVFDGWVSSGYKKEFKPSVDRIDAWNGYIFDNMNWTFWKDNYYKGIQEVSAKKEKPILMFRNNDYIGRFKSVKDAQYFLNMSSNGNISENLKGNRKTVKGYAFVYDNPELLESEGEQDLHEQ